MLKVNSEAVRGRPLVNRLKLKDGAFRLERLDRSFYGPPNLKIVHLGLLYCQATGRAEL